MLEYILSVLNDAVLVYNKDEGKYIFVSDAVSRVTGYDKQSFLERPQLLEEMIHQGDRQAVTKLASELSVPGETELNYRVLTASKELRYIQEKRVQLNHTESNDQLCIHILRDITEAVLYKTDAEHKMWFLSTLVNAVGVLIFRTGVDGRYSFVNDIYTNLLGYSRDDLIGRHLASAVHPDDMARVNDTIQAALHNPGKVYHIKHRKITASGEVRWILTDATAVKNERDEIVEIQGVGMDVTDQQAIEEEMLWTKNNLEALINNTRDLIWSINSDRKYVFLNSSVKDWISQRYRVSLQEGKPTMDDGYPDTMVESWRSYYDRALAGETFSVNYFDVSPLTNDPVTLEVSFNPIRNAANEVIGVGCFGHDISERLKTQEALMQQNERLMKIASLSSHELRGPVATLMGLIDVLDKENPANPQNSQIHEHMQTVSQELDEVIRLIVNKTFI